MIRKTCLILFCFCIFSKLNAQTNVYHPLPDSNGFWQYRHWNVITSASDQKRLGLKGDTVIGTLTYHKVYSLFDSTLSSPWSTYYAAIREQNKQVFAKFGSSPETLLYDFNLAVGDTIRYTYSLPSSAADTFCSILSKVDTMLLKDGKYRKRYIYNPVQPKNMVSDTVIEGLGSYLYQGLFDPLINGFCTCGDEWEVTCIKTYDTTRYLKNLACNHCFCTFLTSESITENHNGNHIYPNPFSSKTTLTINRNIKDVTLTIYNSFGQQVSQIKNVNEQSVVIQRNGLPAGIYFVQLKEQNILIASEKIIIVD